MTKSSKTSILKLFKRVAAKQLMKMILYRQHVMLCVHLLLVSAFLHLKFAQESEYRIRFDHTAQENGQNCV